MNPFGAREDARNILASRPLGARANDRDRLVLCTIQENFRKEICRMQGRWMGSFDARDDVRNRLSSGTMQESFGSMAGRFLASGATQDIFLQVDLLTLGTMQEFVWRQ